MSEAREQAQKKVEALTQLLASEGWKFLETALNERRRIAQNELANAKTGDEAMKAAGALTTVLQLLELPQNTLAQHLQYLQRK